MLTCNKLTIVHAQNLIIFLLVETTYSGKLSHCQKLFPFVKQDIGLVFSVLMVSAELFANMQSCTFHFVQFPIKARLRYNNYYKDTGVHAFASHTTYLFHAWFHQSYHI